MKLGRRHVKRMAKRKYSIGQILMKSLTSEQITGLLTIVSASTDLNIYMEKFEKIDPDMAMTVKKILAADKDSASRDETRRLTSLQRTMEYWSSLWRNYDDIVSEVGDEEGKYAVQDHHWEEPYFDGGSLALDLEPIADDMLTLMADVYDEVDDPDLFLNALEEIASLLTSWADVAKRLNHPGRSAAAALQAVAFHTPENWNTVLKAYRRLSKPDTQGTLAPLFVQWKNEMAARSYPYFMDSRKVTDTWIHWLIDAILDIKQDKTRFLNKLTEWLSDLKDNTKVLKKQWRWLALLTRDLPQDEKIKVKHPFFWETVLIEGDSSGDLTASRRRGLLEMKAGPYLKTALEIWQEQLRRIVPDPASAHKSNYEEYARWAQALFELNRDEYNVLITHWRKKHDRR